MSSEKSKRPRPAEENEESSSDTNSDSDNSQSEIVDDDHLEDMDRLDFDFEALPPDAEDANQIANLLTQTFLRTDINYDDLSKAVVDQSPVGCVFKVTEDYADEDDEDTLYGVSSVVPLTSEQTFGVGKLLLQRARKYADQSSKTVFEKLFDQNNKTKFGFFVNERMLHFPVKIAGPTFSAIKNDVESTPTLKDIDTFVVVLKLRLHHKLAKPDKPVWRRKFAKVQTSKNEFAGSGVVYDNPEEELLFQEVAGNFVHFQYPAHFDVEKESKFHVIRRNGVKYKPFRRVCLLNREQLFDFCDKVSAAFS